MRTSIIATSLALGLFAATSAQAALVTSWGYTVDTKWIAPTTFTGTGGTQITSANEKICRKCKCFTSLFHSS